MKKNKIIFVDMDDVIADFFKSAANNPYKLVDEVKMWDPDFFINLEPTDGSQHAIRTLQYMGYDIWVLTQPLSGHAECYYDKALWINKHFPQLYDKIIMTQDKGMLLGNYLIDDNKAKWQDKFEKNGGKFVHFPYGSYNQDQKVATKDIWRGLLTYFKNQGAMRD